MKYPNKYFSYFSTKTCISGTHLFRRGLPKKYNIQFVKKLEQYQYLSVEKNARYLELWNFKANEILRRNWTYTEFPNNLLAMHLSLSGQAVTNIT